MYDFDAQWRLARRQENSGDPVAAKSTYESILLVEPHRLYVRLRLSAIEQSAGRYRAARDQALRAANAVALGKRPEDLALVTRRLLTFDEYDLVRELIRAADWTHPATFRDSAMLSQHLWLSGNFDEALTVIDAASTRAPSSHALAYSRAQALRYSGRLDEATSEYERCVRLAPDYPYVHWSLAYHETSAVPGARVERVKQAQRAHEGNAPAQAYLSYALFREYEEAGEYDLAWDQLLNGARTKRRELAYDSGREEQGFVALQRLTTREFVRSTKQSSAMDRTPIFIVGLPRSGTTVLERIIGGHSTVVAAGELNDFGHALSLVADTFPQVTLSAAAVEKMQNLDFVEVGRLYLERTQSKAKGARFLIDKNPANFANAGYICKALPAAKILCLSRSPMDACLSNLKELFSSDAYGYSYDLDELGDHYLRFARLMQHWQQVLPADQFHVVDYEQLVTDPMATAARVSAFCGLDFDPGCVDITSNLSPVATASSSQVRQPINAKGIGAWRRYERQLQPLRERLDAALLPLDSAG